MNWRERIVQLAIIKQRLDELDGQGGWQYHLPGVAATEDEIERVERALRESLSPEHRLFLASAGGWRGFFHSVDLFGPADFLGGSRWTGANEILAATEGVVWDELRLRPNDVYPIAVATHDVDIFLMVREGRAGSGNVIWLAGSPIETFRDFAEYFEAMMDYNRRGISRALGLLDPQRH